MTDCVTLAPAADDAPYGYGLSIYDGGTAVHTLAADWTITYHPGHPDSLWAEYRTDSWYPTAPGRCRRVTNWKAVAPTAGSPRRLCPACRLTDAERALLDSHLPLYIPPVPIRAGDVA
ncbi:hypothetical protein WKI65_44130 [Streptomyces sp. MS1.AVA.3]|uniref:hypothetical protein n=1 Tax=Streptomyces decoyicus TaxID=249567 RepID=UPI0030C5E3F2